MNKERESNGSLFNFFTRSMILAFIVTMTYHFTIGVTLTKVDKIMDQVAWIRGKVESLDKKAIEKALHRFPDKVNLTEAEKDRIREDVRVLLEKLSPIVDELYLYNPKSKSP